MDAANANKDMPSLMDEDPGPSCSSGQSANRPIDLPHGATTSRPIFSSDSEMSKSDSSTEESDVKPISRQNQNKMSKWYLEEFDKQMGLDMGQDITSQTPIGKAKTENESSQSSDTSMKLTDSDTDELDYKDSILPWISSHKALQSQEPVLAAPEKTENNLETVENESGTSYTDASSTTFSFSSGPDDNEDDESDQAKKIKITYWEEMSQLPIDKGDLPIKTIVNSPQVSPKRVYADIEGEMDSSDNDSAISDEEEQYIDGKDFYENTLDHQDIYVSLPPLTGEEDVQVYEQTFKSIYKCIQNLPSRFKFEIHALLYPVFTLGYLRIIANDSYKRSEQFFESFDKCFDDSYLPRMEKLTVICRPNEIPTRARNQLTGDEKVTIHMSKQAYDQLIWYMENWPRPQQEKILVHFQINSHDNSGTVKQLPRLSGGPRETLHWAVPDPSPAEDNRAHLSREHLPSIYMYTGSPSNEVVCSSFSENYGMLAVGMANSVISIYSLTSSKLEQLKPADLLKELDITMPGIDKAMMDQNNTDMRRILCGHQDAVFGCCFAPDDRYLLSCSKDKTARLWCLLTWSCVIIYRGHLAPVYCVVYAPMGYHFATGCEDGTARVWGQNEEKPVRIFAGHLDEVCVCLFHPNRKYLATGSADCTIRVWDIVRAVQMRLLSGHRACIQVLAYSICGRYLVSGGHDHLVIVWDTAMETMIRCLAHHRGPISSIEFVLDNNMFLVGSKDCRVSIWDFERLLKEFGPLKLPRKKRPLNCAKDPAVQDSSDFRIKDFLINSYATKKAPIHKLRCTRRNLFLAFSVKPPEEKNQISAREIQMTTFFEHLDMLKLMACINQPNFLAELELENRKESEKMEQKGDETKHASDEYDDLLDKLFW